MPAFNSTFVNAEAADSRVIGNLILLPIHTKFRGPAYPPQQEYDIIEETLDLFRANSFFKNFEIKSNSDRLLIYGILFVSDCLNKLSKTTNYKEAVRILNNLALDSFSLPGDVGFPLNALYQGASNKNESDLLRSYLQQFRQELADRLLTRIYKDDETSPSKHWLAFTKRRFMNKSL
ncbi:actin-related protein 2/3 complex subunit 3 [Scheffersomyces amazonensis]|uniref:actin-related protein 2/3 complex subunit 3 n=1 Tax=Scheffersomyces amazonensis TaxID=1078765 RepID=UPI00315CDC71